ncbi:DUF3533 domain-containing protein [Streptomyces hawaiiensis]|uniref:DUF3533 domain-containing protein n=1 Tax=Streptomyces hawaiiensis TaxID=67305 RepID=UPI00366954D3
MPHRSFLAEVRDAVTPRATLLIVGVIALQLLFIASYVGALHDPKPKDVPFGLVAPQAAADQALTRLERLPGSPLDPRALPDEATARTQLTHRDIDAALIIDPGGSTDTLLVASGGGRVLSTTLTTLVTTLEKSERRTIRTIDVIPSAPHDPNGLSSFYLVIGWCVGGYLGAAALAISAGAKPSSPTRAAIRLAVMALVALTGGLGGALITGPVLDALPGSTATLWGLGTLIIFAVGAATLALQGVFGTIGIGLVILLVVILGNPSAGGALPPPLLPPFWKAIGPALPPGAGTWSTRSIAYFGNNAMTTSLLVLAAWAVAGTAITMAAATLRRRANTPRTP